MTTGNAPNQNSSENIAPPVVAWPAPNAASAAASGPEATASAHSPLPPPSGQRSAPPLPRTQRYLDFAEFGKVGPQRFKKLCAADKDAHEFDLHYSFYAVCKGRWGGNDKRAFDVFFGNRLFDATHHGASQKLLTERGASLSYAQDDRGRVHCILRPASSEGMLPVENAIELRMVKEPQTLLENRLTESHFKDLIAYMQCTSLDGEPSLGARFRIGWLRLSRPLATDDRWQPTKISVGLREVGKYVATVGLSGFLLFGLQAWLSTKDSGPKTVLIGGETAAIQADRAQTREAVVQQKEATLQLSRNVQRFSEHLDKAEAATTAAKREQPQNQGPRIRANR